MEWAPSGGFESAVQLDQGRLDYSQTSNVYICQPREWHIGFCLFSWTTGTTMALRLIDDADPSRVTKDGDWGLTGHGDERLFNQTISYSVTEGDSMNVTFKGSYIAVFGLFDTLSAGVVTNYSIDGAPAAQVTTPPAAGDTARQQFWITKGLAPAQHTLTITMVKINEAPGQPSEGSIWFDYFQVDDPSIPAASDLLPGPSQGSSSGHGMSISTGAIIGIVIGSLFFLLGAAYVFLLWYRMRRESSAVDHSGKRKSHTRQSSIEPFLLSQHAPDHSISSSHFAVASSAERLTFDPNLFVRGPPVLNNRKSFPTYQQSPFDQDSRPATARSRTLSTDASSSSLAGTIVGLPPGARPPSIPPLPVMSIPMTPIHHSIIRPTTSDSSTLQRSTSGRSSHHRRTRGSGSLNIEVVPPSPGRSVVVLSEGEDGTTEATAPPRQHVDSGVREPEVILAHSVRQKRVELPPVYSPV